MRHTIGAIGGVRGAVRARAVEGIADPPGLQTYYHKVGESVPSNEKIVGKRPLSLITGHAW
jgi:hypothetical protein